ncbi:MAG: DUF4136 domain-containing protein [Betaproteobacteria bacterium]|nr:DUF4136 domain-containing protein [Betaproteobacteria bacterium]MDH5352418.1 DUF4136 domain-containing protein [Betaproteobacteria bacterium]
MRTILRSSAALTAIILIFLTVAGCAGIGSPTTTYSYDPLFSFPGSKTYRWADAKPTSWRDPLVEANVRFLADRELQAKGLTPQLDKAALVVWMSYESSPNGYELRALSLNVTGAEGNALVWRGLAAGAIRTDAAAGELPKVVAGMLASFPPK